MLEEFAFCGVESGSFCLLLFALSALRCSSAPGSCLSVSACICFWWLGSVWRISSASWLSVPVGAGQPASWRMIAGCVCSSLQKVREIKWKKKCACEHILILAWLIRMPLAGSCPNRGCHLIKSIICWLNLLELRRKRSVHTLSRPVCLSVSLTHPLVQPLVIKGRNSTHRNP